MNENSVLQEVKKNINEVIDKSSPLGEMLWESMLKVHPADLASFLSDLDTEYFQKIFLALPEDLIIKVFEELSDPLKASSLASLPEILRTKLLNLLHADQLTDLFDLLSDAELNIYLKQLHKNAREKVLSLLKFDPESAGGIMDTDVFSLRQEFTVEKSIDLLRRLHNSQEIFNTLYVTNDNQQLVGHIRLEDLVLKSPKSRINSFMLPNEFVAIAEEDQEIIAHKMVHYSLNTIPVVSNENHFLGIIPSETLAHILVEEASEDVQKMAAVTPLKQGYFDTSFFKMLYQRGYILIVLLMIESFSNTILHAYESTLSTLLYGFIPMIISVGGNSSNQTSAVAIQGMATGEIRPANMFRFWWRELKMGILLSVILSGAGFVRVYYSSGDLLSSVAISIAIMIIVLLSVCFASGVPLLLKKVGVDPAFSAGPFLATVMDILGVLIYCSIIKLILT